MLMFVAGGETEAGGVPGVPQGGDGEEAAQER
jgi:hypothetical protein